MKARSGLGRSPGREQHSYCDCGGWRPKEVPPSKEQVISMLSSHLLSQREAVRVANILVCDDERSICEMLDISLRREGHRVETVQSGQAAKNKIDGALYD